MHAYTPPNSRRREWYKNKRERRSVSRILFLFVTGRDNGHSSRHTVTGMLKRPNPEGKAGHFCLRSGSLLFGLAPSGVYPTFFVSKESGELLPHLFTLTRALLPKNRRCLFCDTLRHRTFSTAMPASFTRHAAVWCSDFPPASRPCGTHRRSSAIGRQFSMIPSTEKPNQR